MECTRWFLMDILQSAWKNGREIVGMQIQLRTLFFDGKTNCVISQDKFLANSKNKISLIKLLTTYLQSKSDQYTKQKTMQTDWLSPQQLTKRKHQDRRHYVLSEDVDLLVLLVGFYDNPLKNVLFLVKPGRKGAPRTLFDIGNLQNTTPHLKRYIFFVHGITGYNYTSAIFQKGKTSAWKLCQTLPNNTIVSVFNNPQSCHNQVYGSDCRFLYEASENVTTIGINYLRYVLFSKC